MDHSKITKALHAVMLKVGYVQKGGENKFHGYKYAGEADLLRVLRPAMLEEGLLLIPSGAECSPVDEHGNTHVSIAYTLAHKDGDVWPEKIIAFGSGNDRNKNGVGDKGTYKALTGANKYLLFKLFQIETGDDPEATDGEKAEDVGVTKIKERWRVMFGTLDTIENEEDLDKLLKKGAVLMNDLKKSIPDWHAVAMRDIQTKRDSFKPQPIEAG